jgi:hypothetical protein
MSPSFKRLLSANLSPVNITEKRNKMYRLLISKHLSYIWEKPWLTRLILKVFCSWLRDLTVKLTHSDKKRGITNWINSVKYSPARRYKGCAASQEIFLSLEPEDSWSCSQEPHKGPVCTSCTESTFTGWSFAVHSNIQSCPPIYAQLSHLDRTLKWPEHGMLSPTGM